MGIKIEKTDWLFLLVCFMLGILAEQSFLHGQIGISYFIFISAFYAVFYWRYRKFPFSHQRIGYLILICIWLLAASFFLNDSIAFQLLNFLFIPCLVIFHLSLITSPKNLKWNQPLFITYVLSRIFQAFKYIFEFASLTRKGLADGVDESKYLVWKKILVGVLISVPVLLIVLNLLMSADTQFERIIGSIPNWFKIVDAEGIIRFIFVLLATLSFFGFMQILIKKHVKVIPLDPKSQYPQLDAVIAITVLVLINAVYILFTVVQFKYFFSGTLQEDLTYAEYARKGFFELMFVTIINLTITVVVLTFVTRVVSGLKRATRVLLSILVLTSAVMLCSAFIRLGLYEEAYGFTFTRVLAHSFMIFLVIVFTYTLMKIWIEKLSLFHFYFISSLLYLTAISVVNMDQIVVKENMARYEQTGKIDVHYLNRMSATGTLGLIDLYQKHPEIPELKSILESRKIDALNVKKEWQSFNLKREEVYQKLRELHLNNEE